MDIAQALKQTREMPSQTEVEVRPGVCLRRTKNGIPVLGLHYSAHPERNPDLNPEWKKGERKKYTSQADWDREQEIMDEAGGGELVFAEILVAHWEKIVIEDPRWKPEPDWKMDAGFDHGRASPTVMLRCYSDYENTHYFCGEYYQPGMEIWEHASNLREMPDLRKLQNCYADPSIFPLNVHANVPVRKGERAKSLSEIYEENGIDFLSPFHGDHSDVSFAARLLMHWANLDEREPTVKIVCRNYSERPVHGLHGWDCPNLLWELMRTRREMLTAQQLLTRNVSEAIVQKDDHARDCMKYTLLSYPEPTRKSLERRVAERVDKLFKEKDMTTAMLGLSKIQEEERQKEPGQAVYYGGNVRQRLIEESREGTPMRRLFTLLVLSFAAAAMPLSAQVSINTNLTTGTMTTGVANLYRSAYLHFQLVNCGDNIPVMPGQSNAVVQDSFDLRPVTPGSAIVGEIIGNDQITCGNVISTYYEVTPMKDASHPLRDGIPYVICSATAAITTCGNAASLGTFNLITADAMSQPPPVPGYVEIYGNPTNSQTINQPINGIGGWTGASTSFTFTNGLILGPVTTAELASLTGFATEVITSDSLAGSNPCTGGGTGALAVYVNGAWSCNQGNSSSTGTVTGFLAPSASWPSWLVPSVANPSTVPDLTVAAGPIPNSALANPSLTVTAGTGLSGGGSVALGAATTLNLANQGSGAGSCTNCNATFNAQGQATAFSNGSAGSFSALTLSSFATIFQSIDNGAPTAYGVISGVNSSGSIANVFATATDTAGQTFSAAASASTNTVIGEDAGEGANYTQFGFGSFYRWSNKFRANNTTNVRYWMGLTNYNTALTGCAAQSVRGNTCFAADYPSTFSIAFRFSAGTDTHWQAVTQTQSAQTVTDTGVAIDTNSHLFEFTNSGSAVNYFIDGTLVATITTNIPSSVGSSGYTPAMFWVGDNKNTATAISATEYWMTMTLK